jgi:hypothetical protein
VAGRYRSQRAVLSLMVLLASTLRTELPPPYLPGKDSLDDDVLPDEEPRGAQPSVCQIDGGTFIDAGEGLFCKKCGCPPPED